MELDRLMVVTEDRDTLSNAMKLPADKGILGEDILQTDAEIGYEFFTVRAVSWPGKEYAGLRITRWNLLIYIGQFEGSYIFLDALMVGGEHVKCLVALL